MTDTIKPPPLPPPAFPVLREGDMETACWEVDCYTADQMHAYAHACADAAVAQERADAQRYRTILANIETLVLRTEKGSTLTLTAKHRGAEFTRSGMDATLDGLGAAIRASKEPS